MNAKEALDRARMARARSYYIALMKRIGVRQLTIFFVEVPGKNQQK